jgi:hypothetical protein
VQYEMERALSIFRVGNSNNDLDRILQITH